MQIFKTISFPVESGKIYLKNCGEDILTRPFGSSTYKNYSD